MISKVLKTAHAVSYMPVRRHCWRVLRRAQRKLNGGIPAPRYRSLLRRADRLEWQPADLARLAGIRLAHEAQCATGWETAGAGQVAVRIHGVSARVTLSRPYAEVPEDLPYLWQMSLGYLGYMLPACAQGSRGEQLAFIALAAGFASPDSWAAPNAHDRHWHPYSASHRLINMIAGRQWLSRSLPLEALAPLDQAIRICTQLIDESTEYDIHYNHLTKNLMALIVSEAFRTGRVSDARFAEYRAAAEYQILRDGGHAELCPMYHAQFLADLLVLAGLPGTAMAAGMAEWLSASIARMQAALRVMSHGDGDIALFGDSWHGEAPASAVLAPGGYDAPAQAACISLPATGYSKLWGGDYCVIIDHGRIGADDNPGHAHDDALSLEVSIGGQRVICDYGVESYTAGPGRTRSRARAFHNAPSFAGDRGMDGWGAFRVGKRTRPPVWQTGTHDGWVWLLGQRYSLDRDGPTTERLVMVHGVHGVLIRDRWLAARGQTCFLLAPGKADHAVTAKGHAAPARAAEAFPVFGSPSPVTLRTITPQEGEAITLVTARDRSHAFPLQAALDALQAGTAAAGPARR